MTEPLVLDSPAPVVRRLAEAVRLGLAKRAFPAEDLYAEVVAVAERMALLPPDIVQLNKRTVLTRCGAGTVPA